MDSTGASSGTGNDITNPAALPPMPSTEDSNSDQNIASTGPKISESATENEETTQKILADEPAEVTNSQQPPEAAADEQVDELNNENLVKSKDEQPIEDSPEQPLEEVTPGESLGTPLNLNPPSNIPSHEPNHKIPQESQNENIQIANDIKSAVEHVLATSAASITSVAGAHATQVNTSPEDMEFNRIKSSYVNTQGEFVLENVGASMVSEVIMSSMTSTEAASAMVSPTSALFTSAPTGTGNSDQVPDYEIIDGTKIYDDGRVEIVERSVVVENIVPTKTLDPEPHMMTEQPFDGKSSGTGNNGDHQVPDIQSSVVEITANIESNNNNDSINVKPTEELNPQVAKSEAPIEQISTSQVIPTITEDEKDNKEQEKIIENSNRNINNDIKIESTEPPKEMEAQTVPPVASSEVIGTSEEPPIVASIDQSSTDNGVEISSDNLVVPSEKPILESTIPPNENFEEINHEQNEIESDDKLEDHQMENEDSQDFIGGDVDDDDIPEYDDEYDEDIGNDDQEIDIKDTDAEKNKAFIQEQLQTSGNADTGNGELNTENEIIDTTANTVSANSNNNDENKIIDSETNKNNNEFVDTKEDLPNNNEDLEVHVTGDENEEVTTEAPQGFFGSLFGGSSETTEEEKENEDTANENTKYDYFGNNNDIPQEQPYENVVDENSNNLSPDIISSDDDEKTNELKMDIDQISSHHADNNNNDEIKFYEPGDAPEYVSTENPANIDSIVQDEKPSLGKETKKISGFLKIGTGLASMCPLSCSCYDI